MDADRAVEIGLGGACCHGDADRLHHLGGVVTDHVCAYDSLGFLIDDELHHGAAIAAAYDVAHWHEVGDVDVGRTVFGGPFLGHSAGADRRLREHCSGYGVERPCADGFAEQAVCQMVAFDDGDRGEVHLVRHVADREDVLLRSGIFGIHDDGSIAGGFDACSIQPKTFGVWISADGEEHEIGIEGSAVRQVKPFRAVRELFEFVQQDAGMERDALRLQCSGELFANVMVEAAQWKALPVEQVHLGAKAAEDSGEFDAYITAADERDALGSFGKVEGLVGDNAEFGAFDVGPCGAGRRPR